MPAPPLFALRRPVMRQVLPRPAVRSRAPRPHPGGLRVGLLGGSFNPAHDGHLHVSIEAMKRLGLDQVWWLVSPQNPLKASGETAPLAERMQIAERIAGDPRIRVSDLERRLGTRYSVDTIARIKTAWPRHRFVWLIGADNLVQLPRWRRWRDLLHLAPIAVVDRETYVHAALAGRAASRFGRFRWPAEEASGLVWAEPPAWVYLRLRPHPASSTEIRREQARTDPHHNARSEESGP